MRRSWLPPLLALLFITTCARAEDIVVAGKVVDADRKPVAGVRVRAILGNHFLDEASVKATTTSNADGSFTIDQLPAPPPYSLYVPASQWQYVLVADNTDGGFGWTSYNTQPKKGTMPPDCADIVLRPSTSVTGRVIGIDDGKGIPGARVTASGFHTKDMCRVIDGPQFRLAIPLRTAATDGEGSFRIDGVPEGRVVTYRVEKDGFAQTDLSPDKNTIHMIRSGNIAGRVVDANGKRVAGVIVNASASDRQPGDPWGVMILRGFIAGSGSATTGDDGGYVIRGLNTLRYNLRLRNTFDLLAHVVKGVDVQAGQTAKAPDLVALPGALITGRVLDAATGEPVNGACVALHDSAYSWGRNALADASGVYSAYVLPGTISACYLGGNANYLFDPDKKTVVSAPATGLSGLDLRVERAEYVRGKVVDETGRPVDRASVELTVPEGHISFTRWTDAEGAFVVSVLPATKPWKPGVDRALWDPGTLAVKAETADHTLGVIVAAKREDFATGSMLLTVGPTHTLTVKVKDPDGKPLQGVNVTIPSRYELRTLRGTLTTDEAGRAQVGGLYMGDRNTLYLRLEGYGYSKGLKLPTVGSAEWKDTVEIVMERTNLPKRLAPNKYWLNRILNKRY